MYRRKGRILAGLLALILVCTSSGVSVLADEGTDQGYTAGLCEHHPEHTDDCGYDAASETPCAYKCDICGDNVSEESSEEDSPARDENENMQDDAAPVDDDSDSVQDAEQNDSAEVADTKEIVEWTWVDEDGVLQQNGNVWGLGVPGASEDNPLTQDALLEMLPKQIDAALADGSEVAVDLTWDLSAIPEEGVWSGDYTVTADVDVTYSLGVEVAPLSVEVEVGGGETYASQENLNANTVEGESPQGTTINVFDYWLSSQNDSDQSNPENYLNRGINNGEVLKFGTGMGTDRDTGENHLNRNTVNYWTGSEAVRSGVVSRVLTDGYPTLSSTLGGGSLAYLFSTSEEHTGKASYPDATGLLQVSDGYFYYNSQDNFAELNSSTEGNAFTLYNTWGVYAGGSSPNGQFFPFDTGAEVFDDAGRNGITQKDVNSVSQYESLQNRDQYINYPGVSINHYFGLTMTTRFVQQYGGHTDESPQSDVVTYEFSGDDDVWVFIDDVLVADLGGIHDAASLEINFNTGAISINGSGTGTLKSMYQAAGRVNSTTWNQNTFADNTYHTLRFFYLERGNTDSNMSLRFNLVTIPESGIIKVDQSGNHIAGARFTLYEATEQYEKGNRICSGVTDDKGELIFVDDQGMIVSLADLYSRNIQYLVLEETASPQGYRTTGDMHLYFYTPNNGQDVVLLSDNEWDTGSYASSKVTAQTGSEITLSDSRSINLDTDGGTLFAVVLQRQDISGDLENSNNWRAVYGDPESGWHVASDSGMLAIIDAAQNNPYEFEVTASGAYEANVENLPGDITKYYYMLSEQEKNNAKYTIAYYYTTEASVAGATIGNTRRVDSDEFERVFSVNLYVPNIQNNLYVQKLDESGTPVSAEIGTATFALYKAEDVTIADDGTYTIRDEATRVQTQTTSDMTMPLELTGGAMFSRIPIGEYYLIETSAPTGYVTSGQAVHVIVDNTGVYADAGTETDAVSVRRGVGSVVRSMVQFATDDDVDTTLHDIKTELVSGEHSGNGFSWDSWDANVGNDLHLQFRNTHAVLEYGTYEGSGNPYFEVESGWSKLLVRQCLAHQEDGSISSKKQHLDENQDLTNLFSGTVTVCVKNQRINSLTISKTVVDESGEAPEDQEFTFTLTMTDASNDQMNASYNVEGTGLPESRTVQFSDGRAELTLSHGESITIRNLPAGAHVNVTESDIEGQSYTTTYAVGDEAPVSGKETGELEITDSGSVNVSFTNTYVPTDDFSFIKTDKDGKALPGAKFALYRLSCSADHNHSEDEISVKENGEFLEDYGDKACWTLVHAAESDDITGQVQFTDIPTEGEYRLVEIKTPDGYAAPGGQWKIVYSDGRFRPKGNGDASVGNPPAIKEENEGGNVTYSIVNYQPGELPFSGNTGIRMFLLIGGMLMILGAAGGTGWYMYHRKSVVVHRRRRRHRI